MTPVKVCSICTCAIVGFGNNAQPINEGRCCDQCNAARHSCAAVAGAKREATRSTSASDLFERLRGLERFGRRWPEAVQRELCLLRGLNVHEEVVVLFFWRLPFPIEVGWIIRQNLDGRAPWENWVLFRSATAQQQIFHAVHFIEFSRVNVAVEHDDL